MFFLINFFFTGPCLTDDIVFCTGAGDYLDSSTDIYVRIDKVMNPILDEYLPKKGYARLRSGDETHYSYHKIIRHRKDSQSIRTQDVGIGLDLTAIQPTRNYDGSYTDR